MSITYHNIESIFTHEPVSGVELAYHYDAKVAHEYESGTFNKMTADSPAGYYGINEVEFCDATVSKMEVFVEGELISTLSVPANETFQLEADVFEMLADHAENQYWKTIS